MCAPNLPKGEGDDSLLNKFCTCLCSVRTCCRKDCMSKPADGKLSNSLSRHCRTIWKVLSGLDRITRSKSSTTCAGMNALSRRPSGFPGECLRRTRPGIFGSAWHLSSRSPGPPRGPRYQRIALQFWRSRLCCRGALRRLFFWCWDSIAVDLCAVNIESTIVTTTQPLPYNKTHYGHRSLQFHRRVPVVGSSQC